MSKRYQLSAPTLEEAELQMVALYGENARIVSAERVNTGGLAGFFAKSHVEVLVDVPGGAVVAVAPIAPRTGGIKALLAEANSVEAERFTVAHTQMSTGSETFADLLSKLSDDTEAGGAGYPRVADRPGDLVVIAGLGSDALEVASSMAIAGRTIVTPGGVGAVGGGVHDRTSAMRARAEGVTSEKATIVAYGLGTRRTAPGHTQSVASIGADQVWLAVDATRKAEDTQFWVRSLGSGLTLRGLAIINAADTLTPHTVDTLGIPVGWIDGSAPTGQVA